MLLPPWGRNKTPEQHQNMQPNNKLFLNIINLLLFPPAIFDVGSSKSLDILNILKLILSGMEPSLYSQVAAFMIEICHKKSKLKLRQW